MASFSLSKFSVPWFMMTETGMFITSTVVPNSSSRSRPVNRSKEPVPGAGWERSVFGNIPNETVEFSIKLVQINDSTGVAPQLAFFEMLTTPHSPIWTITTNPLNPPAFTPPPEVLYMYGLGKLPMWYFVDNVQIKPANDNRLGVPQEAEISVTLTENRDSKLYRAERWLAWGLSVIGTVSGAVQIASMTRGSKNKGSNPYIADALESLKKLMK